MRIPLLLASWSLFFLTGCYYPDRGFHESSFDLMMEKRLPKPFDPNGKIAPKGYTAKIEFYSETSQINVRLVVFDPNRKKIFDEMGTSWWHPSGSYQGRGHLEYPSHTVILINGIKDILEHRESGPILYLTDDEKLWKYSQKVDSRSEIKTNKAEVLAIAKEAVIKNEEWSDRADFETPSEALARFDGVSAKTENPLKGDLFTGIGREVAFRHQIALIPLILDKSNEWEGEEGLLYMPIVLNLPLDDAIKEFQKYLKGPDKEKALWAREFLIEIEAYLAATLKKVSPLLEKAH